MSRPLHIHLVAVCGTGMGALAVMLKSLGHRVTGSDENVYPPMSTVLSEQQIPVFEGFSAANLDPRPDLVVIGNAVSRGNPEAEAVLELKIRYASMPETLKSFFLWERKSIIVAGTHGKTTTTAMLAWVLTEAGLDPSYIVGGVPVGWQSGARLGSGDLFILEGDEYDSAFFDKRAKFLHYLPDTVIINNVEFDHADIYDSIDEIALSFRRLVNIIPKNGLLIGPEDDERVLTLASHAHCAVHTLGMSSSARWSARNVSFDPGGTSFDLYERDEHRARLSTDQLGDHNVRNALAVIAAARHYGVSWPDLARGLASFPGVKRRLEVRGEVNGITVYDDFAHHPTAVRATLDALSKVAPCRRTWAVFEPRSATTIRRTFQDAYATAFDQADRVLIAPVYLPEKAPPGNRFSVEELVAGLRERGVDAEAPGNVEQIVWRLAGQAEPGDRIVFMSNGGFGGIHEKTMNMLERGRAAEPG
ncbi:MAG: UDP-N-acetylmuramate:L-alanyl-gamma-D-glutamyl-meso-diaminopimelate ligase [Gemmatimonadetes bacterium]|nr:UDP-N-acetylmuramate:L-alanyl-gamma-D-glutamyl-meso-diaminopimelate ligase [Gemmatimonadota bacterium]MYG86223.1 UDP-N-acetylmuramate:L-alanyl-gamma-D-glutamyl-meso-diaminopimelate ligase [Gemmatimonadota bacterium]MYJ90277.1 UDP-N-acetylmuramate:L-alanyl-gamma-D-glutamyl-meso-diaminopimelate ligase [Gemmatimonadota bacterium]